MARGPFLFFSTAAIRPEDHPEANDATPLKKIEAVTASRKPSACGWAGTRRQQVDGEQHDDQPIVAARPAKQICSPRAPLTSDPWCQAEVAGHGLMSIASSSPAHVPRSARRQDRDVSSDATSERPALICFDGSDDAVVAIAAAGEMLAPRAAVVLAVSEPVASWAPYDPATILGAPLSRLASKALDLDDITREVAREQLARGSELATSAGFRAEGRLEVGKPWRIICDIADELGAEPIVVGARGLGRVESALLGSVSTAVVFHTKRPVLVVPHHQPHQPVTFTDR